jgi:hypothetical protein
MKTTHDGDWVTSKRSAFLFLQLFRRIRSPDIVDSTSHNSKGCHKCKNYSICDSLFLFYYLLNHVFRFCFFGNCFFVYDDFGNKEELYTLKIKISKGHSFGVSIVEPSDEAKEAETIDYISVPAYIDSSLIQLHDFGSNLTPLSFNNFKNNSCYLDIN